MNQPALYFLCERKDKQVYIGESEDLYKRIQNHDQNKDFWEVVIAFVSGKNDIDKADVKFLESIAVDLGKKANRYEIANTTIPKVNNLHKAKQAKAEDFFEDVKILTSVLGYPIFDEVKADNMPKSEIWFCKGTRGADARGVYDENGFTVLQNSKIAKGTTPSFGKELLKVEKRNSTLKQYSHEEDGSYVLQKNITFDPPSAASCFVLGRYSNGWSEWKNEKNDTLDQIMRQQIS